MPEGGNKRNKGKAGVSDEAAAGSPKWKIKSSCVWLIPGDVPGQRSMSIAPPAPRRLLVFKPKPVEPVQKATHQVSQSATDSGSNIPDLAKSDLVKSGSNSSDSSHIESAKGSANEKIATGADSPEGSHTGLSDNLKQAFNSVTSFNHKTDSSTNKVAGLGDAQAVNQESELEGSDKGRIVKPGVPSGAQLSSANHSYDKRPFNTPAASTMQETLNQARKFNYRKIIPALLLLLLILLLGSLGKDYFANRPNLTTVAVSEVENNNIAQASLTEATPVSVPEERPVNSDEPDQLPVESISLSKIGRQSLSGLRIFTHTVVRGDTLWDISKAYLQNPFRYPELAKLSHIKNPDLIYPGEIIYIHIKIEEYQG